VKNESEKRYDVVIVGGGFSGTMVAVHLARAQAGLRIALVDRGPAAGRGVAYGTTDPKHLLNVPAGDMGAFPDDINHFYRWLQSHPQHLAAVGIPEVRPDSFVPRMVFGDYIQDLLRQARSLPGTLDLIQDEVLDIKQMDKGHFEVTPKAGRTLKAAHVVLALGNFPPGGPEQNGFDIFSNRDWFLNNPYAADVHAKLAEPGDVLIIGTGLTSLDVLLSLDKIKREGKIHILSRRGLFPEAHKKSTPYPPFLDAYNLPRTAHLLFRRVARELRRAHAHGVDWRPVLDSMRPFNQAIWTHLPLAERLRFLRHVQPIWDTHRHRCVPEVMAVKNRLEAEGRLVCHRGEIQDFHRNWKNVEATFRARGTNEIKKLCVRYVLSCTGPQADYRKLKDPLVRRLLASDLLAPDPMRMGANTAQGGRVCNKAGEVIQGLYTLGSLQKGRLYESIAVPELRCQAAALAGLLRAEISKKPLAAQSLQVAR
jgi:uncharacterized NAD(P)/FAD-binding protein YdhS